MTTEVTSDQSFEEFEFFDFCFGYDTGEELFSTASVKLPANEVVLVDGPSGAGKSAMLKVMAGLVPPTRGHFNINSLPVSEFSFEEFLPYRLKIGYSFEHGGLLSNCTVAENLLLPLHYHNVCSRTESEQRVKEHLELFKLTGVADLRPSAISGGMRKATVVARSLVLYPELLLLDNPTTGLNKELREALAGELLRRIEEGTLKHVFVVSEDVRFLSKLVTRRVEIRNRKIIFDESESINQLLGVSGTKAVGS